MYYTNVKKLKKSNRKKNKKGIKRYLPPSVKYSKQNHNNFINFSLINGFRQKISHIRNNFSYNYIINSKKSNSGIYNSYIANPTVKIGNLTKIYSNFQIYLNIFNQKCRNLIY